MATLRTLSITTPSFATYNVNLETGYINGSSNWKFLGLKHVKRTSEFIPLARIPAWLEDEPDLRYKNGNPQYTIVDLDHGTRRVHGNTPYHGVRYAHIYTDIL